MKWEIEIDRWLAKSGIKAGRLGLLAAANPYAVGRIKDGSAQVATLIAVLKYIRAHPPKGRRTSRRELHKPINDK